MKGLQTRAKKILAFSLPLGIGLLILVLMVLSREPPAREENQELAVPVRVLTLAQQEFVPRVTGYGLVEPRQTWQALAEVSGKVVELHPQFEVGRWLPAGSVLVAIDPAEYEIAVARSEAQVHRVQAQIAELDQEKLNLERRLALERQNLALAEREYRRNLSLVGDGSVSELVMEQAERDVLRQKLQVTQLENSLATLPARNQQLSAQLESDHAALRDSQRRLSQTQIRLPFSGRIAVKAVELGQAVGVGSSLGEAHGVELAEINAGFALEKLASLVEPGPSGEPSLTNELSVLLPESEIQAVVRLPALDPPAQWPARFSRIDAGLDTMTRTLGVIVVVDDPYGTTTFSGRPPLVKGMYCEVELRGLPRRSITVPRSAVRGGRALVAGPDNRLQIREVRTGSGFADLVEVTAGLLPGDRLVVSDLTPAVEGMLLDLREDRDLANELMRLAQGGGNP